MIRSTFGNARYHAGENDVVLGDLPSWLGDQPNGVIFCHGAGESAAIAFADEAQNAIMRGCAANATVHVGDLGGSQPWGNNLEEVEDAIAYLRSDWGQEGPVVFVGVSAGAPSALAYALANPDEVAAVALVIPALDLNDLLVNRGQSAIDTAYGGTYDDETDGLTHNPVRFVHDLPTDLPIKVWSASDDPVCVPAATNAFVGSHPLAVNVNVGALGHSDAAVEAAVDGVTAFVRQYTT